MYITVCRYSSVISSHYLSSQEILRINRAMLGPRKCKIKEIPVGNRAHFSNCKTAKRKEEIKKRSGTNVPLLVFLLVFVCICLALAVFAGTY